MTEIGHAKLQGISPLSILATIFVTLSFSMLLFSSFGPIDSNIIPFHPMGWAGIFVFLAMVFVYSQNYQRTKDTFWFVVALIFFPVLLSDLYFFPIPAILGFGMGEWMGVQVLISFACFTAMSKVGAFRYSNLAMLLLLPFAGAIYFFPTPELSFLLIPISYLFGFVITATLSYYAHQRKEYVLIMGAFLNFMVSIPIPMMYISVGYIPFGWTQPLMAVVTDRIAIFGRILMVVSLPSLILFLKRGKMSNNYGLYLSISLNKLCLSYDHENSKDNNHNYNRHRVV